MEMKGNADAVYKELVANLIPNSHMVAAGVVAVNRAQEYGFTLLSTRSQTGIRFRVSGFSGDPGSRDGLDRML